MIVFYMYYRAYTVVNKYSEILFLRESLLKERNVNSKCESYMFSHFDLHKIATRLFQALDTANLLRVRYSKSVIEFIYLFFGFEKM